MTDHTEAIKDTGDEVEVKKRRRGKRWEREQEIKDIQEFCSNPANLAFLWRLLAQCGMFKSSSWASPTDMAISSGKRDIGLWLLAELETAVPDVYLAMKTAAQLRKERMNERDGNSSYS